MIKTTALVFPMMLSLFCAAQHKSNVCKIASGPLAGMLEHADSTGIVGSPCSDAAGNHGSYVSSDEQYKNYDHAPGHTSAQGGFKIPMEPPPLPSRSAPQPTQAPPPVPKEPKPGQYSIDTQNPGSGLPSTKNTEASAASTKQFRKATKHDSLPLTTTAPEPTSQNPTQQVHLWYEGLPDGSVKYHVPTPMVLGETYTATAVLHPPGRAKASGADGSPLKVSTYMRIVLAKPDNPDTFEIQPEEPSCKFVPIDTDTTWTYSVKPILPGDNKHLSFSAYAVYGVDDSSCAPGNLKLINVLSETETVTIAAITRQRAWQEIVVSFLSDPAKWFKFILPGGTGFVVIGGLIRGWRRRQSSKTR